MVQHTNGLLFLQHGPHSLLIFWFCSEIIVLEYDDSLSLSPCHAILHILLAFSIAIPTWKRYFYPLHNRTNYKWVFRTLDCERHKSTILCDIKFNKCSIPIKLCQTAEHLCRDMKVGSFLHVDLNNSQDMPRILFANAFINFMYFLWCLLF